MRVTSVGFSLALGLGSLGSGALMAASGCGQLWRPFLEPQPAGDDDLGAADLAVPIPPPPPADLGAPVWTVEPSGTTQTLYGVWGIHSVTNVVTPSDGGTMVVTPISQTPVFAVGGSGTLLKRTSSSGLWAAQTAAGVSASLYAVTGRSPTDVVAVGEGQLVAQWNGSNWSGSAVAGAGALLGVTPSVGTSSYLAVGAADSLYVLTSTMRSVPGGYNRMQVDLTSTYISDSRVWIGTGRGDLVKYEQGTFSPSGLPAGSAIRSIWARAPADVWAVGDGGYVLRFDGTSWSTSTTRFPALTLNLYGVTGNSRGEVYVVGEGGTILYFDGTAWTRWQHPSQVTLRGVFLDPDSGGVWAVGDRGTILHSGPPTK